MRHNGLCAADVLLEYSSAVPDARKGRPISAQTPDDVGSGAREDFSSAEGALGEAEGGREEEIET